MYLTLNYKKRHWVGTFLEIIVPAVLFMALVALREDGKRDKFNFLFFFGGGDGASAKKYQIGCFVKELEKHCTVIIFSSIYRHTIRKLYTKYLVLVRLLFLERTD